MNTKSDLDRRKAAIKEIRELGHIPIAFEEWAGRAISDVIEYCNENVKGSDLFVIIIDDTISDAMDAEHDTALNVIGLKKVFYYFTSNGERDKKAENIWETAKHGYLLKEFSNKAQLRREIKKSIASYMEDALKQKRESKVIFNETISLKAGREWHKDFSFNSGDIVTITGLSDNAFYAGFFSREEYVNQRKGGFFGGFNFEFDSDKSQYTTREKISQDDDYYLVIRVSSWGDKTTIQVKIKREYLK